MSHEGVQVMGTGSSDGAMGEQLGVWNTKYEPCTVPYALQNAPGAMYITKWPGVIPTDREVNQNGDQNQPVKVWGLNSKNRVTTVGH